MRRSVAAVTPRCRCLDGAHPLLLVPRATAVLSCWAAALHFAASYWSSIPSATPVWGALATALAASGLHGPPQGPHPLPPGAAAHPAAGLALGGASGWQGATQGVAVLLLRRGGEGAGGPALGVAVVEALAAQLQLQPTEEGGGGAGGLLPHQRTLLLPHQVRRAAHVSLRIRRREPRCRHFRPGGRLCGHLK